jgi:cysteine desulfurase
MDRVYLDNNGTTFIDLRVKEIIIEGLECNFGNAGSLHEEGRQAKSKITAARDAIAKILGVRSSEIFFHSGGTEGINHLIHGIMRHDGRQGHLITSNLEHSCVYKSALHLEAQGYRVSFLTPGETGCATPEMVERVIQPDTKLIVLMAANNETGVMTDIESIAKIAAARNIPFVVDGVAILGKDHFSIPPGVSAVCFSGHKFHAPKGIGFSFIRKGVKVDPLLRGGNQEYGFRPGTENLLDIIALKRAVELVAEESAGAIERMRGLRDQFEKLLIDRLGSVMVNGGESSEPRVSNTSNLAFEGVEAEVLLMQLDQHGVAASAGAACSSGGLEPSRVLLNMGYSRARAGSSVRFSLSRMTTAQEIEVAVERIVLCVNSLRGVRC